MGLVVIASDELVELGVGECASDELESDVNSPLVGHYTRS